MGIATEASGLAVLDIDPRNGGTESFVHLELEIGALPLTVECLTGGGGRHLYFRAPPGEPLPSRNGQLAAGIDTKAKAAYVIAPPSNHRSGGVYAWREGHSPSEIALAELPEPWVTAIRAMERKPSPAGNVREGAIPEGARNSTLTSVAGGMRRQGISEEAIYAALKEINALQCTSPLSEPEVRGIARSISRYEPTVRHSSERVSIAGRRVLLGNSLNEPDPPYDWVEEGILLAGHVTLLYGQPANGKTWLAYAWAADLMLAGGKVLIVDEDSGFDMLRRRLRLLGLGTVAIDDYLHYFGFPGFTKADADEFIAYAVALQPRLIIFDALVDMLGVIGAGENDATAVNAWLRDFAARLSRETGAAVLVLDHPQKDGASLTPRGSGAKSGKTDIVFLVTKSEDFDPFTAGVVTLKRKKNRVGMAVPFASYRIGGPPTDFVFERIHHESAGPDPRMFHFLGQVGPEGFVRKDVEAALHLGKEQASTLIRQATEAGLITPAGKGRAIRYHTRIRPADEEKPQSDDSPGSNRPIRSSPLKGEESDETP